MADPASNISFTLFTRLPVEIRLRIWAQACTIPRAIDIWADFKRCESNNSIFFCQLYFVELAPLPPPSILSTCHEAREEALKHYSLEFMTHIKPAPGLEASMPAKWYVNWECDIFVPRGYWNMVSFTDFVTRGLNNGLKRVAIDVSGSFWNENLKGYLRKDCWALNGVQEVVLYDPREDQIWKGSDYLDKFRRRRKDGPRVLSFELLETPGRDILHVQKMFNNCWGRIEGVTVEEEPEMGITRSCVEDFDATAKEHLMKPEVKLMMLVTTKPVGAVVERTVMGAGVLD